MAVLTQDDLLEAIDKMTVLELSEFIKRFEERYGVTAAAPAAAAAAPAAAGGGARGRCRGADRVHRHPDRDRAEQDPGHQGRSRADRPRPQGGQGSRRRVAQGRQGRRHQGRGREDQGRPRGAGREGRDQVAHHREGAGVPKHVGVLPGVAGPHTGAPADPAGRPTHRRRPDRVDDARRPVGSAPRDGRRHRDRPASPTASPASVWWVGLVLIALVAVAAVAMTIRVLLDVFGGGLDRGGLIWMAIAAALVAAAVGGLVARRPHRSSRTRGVGRRDRARDDRRSPGPSRSRRSRRRSARTGRDYHNTRGDPGLGWRASTPPGRPAGRSS